MNSEQIIEMLKLLSKHFPITICSDMNEYVITTRLCSTDHYINANYHTFEGAFYMFTYETLKHVCGKLNEEMLEILK